MIPVRSKMCTTCPFRKGSEYQDLAGDLAQTALSEGSRICHSTGTNAIGGRTGKPDELCRGARNFQLEVFAGINFISAPTDEAWATKCEEMGIQ